MKNFSKGAVVIVAAVLASVSFAGLANASSCSVWAENSYTLRWTSTSDASSAYINNGVGSVGLNGTYNIGTATYDRTYTMTVTDGYGRTDTCQTTVEGQSGSSGNYVRPTCAISFSPTSSSNYPYNGGTLTWSSWNATSASISPSIGSVGLNGSRFVDVGNTYEYTMYVSGPGGSNSCRTTVTTQPTYGNLYCTLSASPSTIQNGASAVLSWTSNGARRAWLSDGIGNVNVSGSLTVRPEASRMYTLTVLDGQGRTSTCDATVNVSGSTVQLSQIPYTGDFGPLGTALSWLAVTLVAAAAAGLIARHRFV